MKPPVSSSRGPMGSLLVKLDSILECQQLLRNPVREEFELLKEDLLGIDTFLRELSDEDDPNLVKKYWMKEVREICYDTEDYIDWLIHSEAKIRSVGIIPRLKICNLPSTLTPRPRLKMSRLPSTLIPRPKIANQIKELRARLEDAGERYKRYVLDNNSSYSYSSSVHSHSHSHSHIPWIPQWYREAACILVGINDSKKKLISLLNSGEKKLNVISVCGLGGIGKTTLAKQILQELGGQFGCHAFVRVSRKPDTRTLLRSILSQTGCRNHSEACNILQLTDYLREHLQQRRYLIVVDDLWDTAVWEFLVSAFSDGNHSSRIITTTTTENVAMTCCGNRSDYILKMEPLNDDDSRKLFFARVFGSENKCPEQFKDASYEIIRKCGGVPLAVIQIAGLLARQQDKSEWDYVERSLGSNLGIRPTYEGMIKMINLSYNGLPECLKTCLQYVSMYPENCMIWKDDLVRRWVAEGFIEGGSEVIAQSHFEELVYRGMIHPIDIDYNEQVLSCTVHHMILDFVRNKSAEENFITTVDYSKNTRELSSKVRRLFLFYSTAKYAAKLSVITLLQVRTLAFYGLVKCLPSIQEFKFLRVLVLHLWGDYKDSTILNLSGINRLFLLRYLKVTCNHCLQLPNHMGGLHRLETLEINAKVATVPEDIVHLKYLVHLSLPQETKLPYEVGCLRSLRTLKCFDFCGNSDDEVKSLQELSCLEEFQLVLTTAPSDSVDRNLKVLFSILGCLYDLKSLVIVRGASVPNDSVTIIDSSSMSCPTDCLERLELDRGTCILRSLPKWIGQLGSLCILKLGVLEILKNDVDSFAGLQVLKSLSLYVQRPTVEPIIFSSGAFPALERFKVRSGVLCIAFRPGAMPKLHRLKLCFNASSCVEYGSNMLVGIEHLLNLQEVSGRIGAAVGSKESDKRIAESTLKDAISKHSMIPRLNIQIVDWIEEDHVPAKDIVPSKMQINKLSEDHGFSVGKSEVNTNIKVDEWTSSLFSDAVVTSSDVLNSDDKRKRPYVNVKNSNSRRLSTTADIMSSYSDKSFYKKAAAAMVGVGEMLAAAVIKEVVRKLSALLRPSVLVGPVKRIQAFREDLETMNMTLESIKAAVADAEKRSINDALARLWLKRLKNTAYEISDMFDDFQPDRPPGKLQGTQMWYKVMLSGDVANHMKRLNKKLNKIREQRENFGIGWIPEPQPPGLPSEPEGRPWCSGSVLPSEPEGPGFEPQPPHICAGTGLALKSLPQTPPVREPTALGTPLLWIPEPEQVTDEEPESVSMGLDVIVGRRVEKESVINILLSSNNKASATNTYVQEIGNCTIIHGLAGVGKTELAKLVFNDERIWEAFPQRAWVYLRPNCNEKEFGRAIISVIEGRSCNLEILESIYQHLKMVLMSRCLIVLDNLWNSIHLASLQGILGSNVSILVTSRKAIQLDKPNVIPFPLDPLSDKHSFDLVKQVASSYFLEGGVPETAVDEIVAKCRGVPLALKTVASLLKPGTGKDLLSLIRTIFPPTSDYGQDSIEKTVFGSLKLTYHLMAPSLKLCFAYCSIFDKGCEIDREDLCHQWIALGLIENPWKSQGIIENPGGTKRIAEEKVRELLDMSFLQDSGPSSVTVRSSGASAKLKMHDLVHDLAKLVADDELVVFSRDNILCFPGKDNILWTPDSHRYAVVFACEKDNLHKNNQLAGLRALHIKDCPGLKFKWSNYLFAKRLRILDISGHHMEKLPSSIGNLIQLRYLNASGIQCKQLPKAIGTLSKLQYLNLHGSSISVLPDSVTKLGQLMHLDISDCKNLQTLPSSFCQLKCLCFLSLKNCYQLCSLPDDLVGLENLENLNLSGCSCLCNLPESLGGLENLKQLNLSGCKKLTMLPNSFVRLTDLQYLNISSCSELTIHVDGLNKLVNLNYVDMSSCPKLVGLPEEFYSLKYLHTLNLSDCSNLVNLPERLGQMKSIRFILLDGCAESVRKPILQHRLGAGLQSLPAFVIEAQVGSIRSNITQLEQEKFSELELYRLENVRTVGEAEALKMPARSGLRSLGLMWTLNVGRFTEDEALLQALEPPEDLQKFRVQGYMGERFPMWNVEIGSFRRRQLNEVCLMYFPMCNSLPQLGQLANLKKLHLCRIPKIRRLDRELSDKTGSLKNLQSFTLEYMENLEEWCTTMASASSQQKHEGFMFPSLQELNIFHCPLLRMVPCPPRSINWEIRASSKASQQLLRKDEAMQSLAEYMGLQCPFGYTTELHVNGSNSSSPSDGWNFNGSLITLNYLTSDSCSLIDTLLSKGNSMQCLVNLEISGIEDGTRSLLEQVETVVYYTRSSLAKSWPDWFPQHPSVNSGSSPHFLVTGCASCALDGWIDKLTSFLGNLIRINMDGLPMCDRLPPLGHLPVLQELRLKGMPKITRIDDGDLCRSERSSSVLFFPRLTRFVLNDMPNLEEWVVTVSGSGDHCGREEFMFPKLVKLTIWNCPKLKLRPGLPRAEEWDINNSDQVIASSYDKNNGGGEIAMTLQVLLCKVAPNNWKLLDHLPRIKNLVIISCHVMEALPESIQSLPCLQSLTISKCHGLKHLPEWLGDLTSLESLMLVSCPLEFLPGRLRRLSLLRSLTLSCCDRLAALPRWMGDLKSLVKLTIEGCKILKSLPQLYGLQDLLIHCNDQLHRWCESEANKAKFAEIKRQGFWLESHGQSYSYILPARSLCILWGRDDRHWRMHSNPHSRFAVSMELLEVWWLVIEGTVPEEALAANTSYDIYLVYKLADEHDGLRWGESCVLIDGERTFGAFVSFVDQDAERVDRVAYPVTRSEGWMELRLGEFSIRGDGSKVEVSVYEKTDTYAKRGLIVEGMEIRAKGMPIT